MYRVFSFVVIFLMPQTLQLSISLKNSFNSEGQLSNRTQTKIGKVLKKSSIAYLAMLQLEHLMHSCKDRNGNKN